jgi:prepilin-type N-terminal cleavage/methylation domain-containing protein
MKRSKGFTLIELLVVIAIIALLLSILLPSLQAVKEKARGVVCLANYRQFGLAFNGYLSEYNNKFMGEWLDVARSGTRGGEDIWVGSLSPYYGDSQDILSCPSAVRSERDGGKPPRAGWSYLESSPYRGVAGKKGSYMINWWVTNPYNYRDSRYIDDPKSWKTDLVRESNDTIPVLGAGGAVWRAFPDDTDALPRYEGDWAARPGCSMSRFSTDRHEKGNTQMLFMDWSARKVGLKELWTLKWNRDFNIANQYTILGGMTPGQWPEWMKRFKDF